MVFLNKLQAMSDSKRRLYATVLFVIIYAVGLFGLSNDSFRPLFIRLTPPNLIFSALILVWFHKQYSPVFIRWALMVAFFGFLVELIGVNTGFPFGEYSYGAALGLKLMGTPLMIGLNWLILSYSSAVIAQPLSVPKPIKALLAATAMLIYDWVLEPVAIKLDFWTWAADTIPLSNYAAWFFISLAFQLQLTERIKSDAYGARLVFVGQFCFFLILSWLTTVKTV